MGLFCSLQSHRIKDWGRASPRIPQPPKAKGKGFWELQSTPPKAQPEARPGLAFGPPTRLPLTEFTASCSCVRRSAIFPESFEEERPANGNVLYWMRKRVGKLLGNASSFPLWAARFRDKYCRHQCRSCPISMVEGGAPPADGRRYCCSL